MIPNVISTSEKINSIIIIDDDDTANFIFSKTIAATGLAESVTTFNTGQEAIKYLKDKAKTCPQNFPSLIFIDINMPVMNGWQFLEKYNKKILKYGIECIICVLSSSVYEEDIEKAYSYPIVNEYISKPLTKEAITRLYDKFFK